jgi:hypothetical protein
MTKIRIPFVVANGPDNKPVVMQKEGEFVTVVDQKEPWSEYILEDGTIIRTKQTLLQVVKMDEPGPDGKPVYNMQAQPNCSCYPKKLICLKTL